MSPIVVVFFNKDVIIIKPLVIALLLVKIALFLALIPFRKCLKLLLGVGGSMTASDFPDYQQQLLEILVTTPKQGSTDYNNSFSVI